MADILYPAFSITFIFVKTILFWLTFHRSLFVTDGPNGKTSALVQVMLGAKQVTSHYTNQGWNHSQTHIYAYGFNELSSIISISNKAVSNVGKSINVPRFTIQGECLRQPLQALYYHQRHICSLIARFMGPTWGPSGADRTQVGPVLATGHLGPTGPRWALCGFVTSYLNTPDCTQVQHIQLLAPAKFPKFSLTIFWFP